MAHGVGPAGVLAVPFEAFSLPCRESFNPRGPAVWSKMVQTGHRRTGEVTRVRPGPPAGCPALAAGLHSSSCLATQAHLEDSPPGTQRRGEKRLRGPDGLTSSTRTMPATSCGMSPTDLVRWEQGPGVCRLRGQSVLVTEGEGLEGPAPRAAGPLPPTAPERRAAPASQQVVASENRRRSWPWCRRARGGPGACSSRSTCSSSRGCSLTVRWLLMVTQCWVSAELSARACVQLRSTRHALAGPGSWLSRQLGLAAFPSQPFLLEPRPGLDTLRAWPRHRQLGACPAQLIRAADRAGHFTGHAARGRPSARRGRPG